MSYLKIDPSAIKFAGGGDKLQWAMAIGVGVDQFVHEVARPATDVELLANIRERINSPGLDRSLRDPSKLDTGHRKVIDDILQAVGTKLTTNDLHKVFSENAMHGGRS